MAESAALSLSKQIVVRSIFLSLFDIVFLFLIEPQFSFGRGCAAGDSVPFCCAEQQVGYKAGSNDTLARRAFI